MLKKSSAIVMATMMFAGTLVQTAAAQPGYGPPLAATTMQVRATAKAMTEAKIFRGPAASTIRGKAGASVTSKNTATRTTIIIANAATWWIRPA